MWGAVSSLPRWGGTASCPASCLVHLLKCFPAFHTQGGFFPTAPGATGCSCPASMFPPRHVEAHLTAGGSYPLRSGHSKAAPELNCQLCLPMSLPHHCLLTCQPVGLSMPLLFPGTSSSHRSPLSSARCTQQPMGLHRKCPVALLLPSPSHITEG